MPKWPVKEETISLRSSALTHPIRTQSIPGNPKSTTTTILLPTRTVGEILEMNKPRPVKPSLSADALLAMSEPVLSLPTAKEEHVEEVGFPTTVSPELLHSIECLLVDHQPQTYNRLHVHVGLPTKRSYKEEVMFLVVEQEDLQDLSDLEERQSAFIDKEFSRWCPRSRADCVRYLSALTVDLVGVLQTDPGYRRVPHNLELLFRRYNKDELFVKTNCSVWGTTTPLAFTFSEERFKE